MGDYISGEDYAKWIAKGILYIQQYYRDTPLYERFLEASKLASGGVRYYDTLMGILKAVKEFNQN